MSNSSQPPLYQRTKGIISTLLRGLHERDHALRLSLLAALAGQSVFFLGPPGVAKSLVARRIALAFSDARFFEYLMGRFSTPDELFGPVSIARLKHEDRYSRNTRGYLPEADIVFLDEIWKASPPIQNSLLAALNERIFRNGDETQPIPLKCFIAASNEIPVKDETRAFWDRFLIRIILEPVQEKESFRKVILESDEAPTAPDNPVESSEWEAWSAAIPAVEIGADLLEILHALRNDLRSAEARDPGFYISDRRWKQITRLLKASAYFHGRSQADLVDAFLLPHCLWNSLEHRDEVMKLFSAALKEHAFLILSGIRQLRRDFEAWDRRFEQESSELAPAQLLEPVRYDGEYLHFIPDEVVREKELEDSNGGTEPEYRIWFDDLEDLDERGELELFIHRNGNFLQTRTIAMSWEDRSAWRLTGDLGSGAIECVRVTAARKKNKPLTPALREELSREASDLEQKISEGIRQLEHTLDSVQEQAAAHLFVPGGDTATLLSAAAARKEELEILLGELLGMRQERDLNLGA